jgi:CelD/BcsL family acetyltransferase involved in cellulose biosynthesis
MTPTIALAARPRASTVPGISTRTITTLPALERELNEGLLGAWKGLVHADPLASCFQSPGWCLPWYRSYHDEYDPFVVVVETEGVLAGVVPLAVRRGTREIGFATGTMADYRDIVAAPEHRATVVDELIRVYLDTRFTTPLQIGWIDPASDTPALVAAACGARHVRFRAWQQPCYRWFPADGENLNKKFSRIRTHLNHFKRLGNVTFEVIERQDDWASFRDAFFQQHSLRQLQADRAVTFDDPRKRRFYDRLFDSETVRTHATALRLDGEQLAGHVGFVWRDVLMLGAPSISLEHEPRSPALVLLSWIIQNAATLGLKGFDLTIGDTEFKRRLGNQRVEVTSIEVYGSRAAFYAHAARRRAIQLAKAGVQRVFGEHAWDDRVKSAIAAASSRLQVPHGASAKRPDSARSLGTIELAAADLDQATLYPGQLRENRIEDLLLWTGEDPATVRATRECARVYARQRAAGASLHTLIDGDRLLGWCFLLPPSEGAAQITVLKVTPDMQVADGARTLASAVARVALERGAQRVLVTQD